MRLPDFSEQIDYAGGETRLLAPQCIMQNTFCLRLCVCTLIFASLTASAQMLAGDVRMNDWSRSFSFEKPLGVETMSLDILNRNHLAMVLAVGIGGYAVHRWDETIDKRYAFKSHGFPGSILQSYGELGGWYDSPKILSMAGTAALATWIIGRRKGNRRSVETIELLSRALLVSTIATTTLKIFFGRARPYTGAGPYEFEVFDFYMKSKAWSFPSGHTASVFALMTVLSKRSDSRLVKSGAWFLAGSVGFQRMLHRKHWASDIVAGGLVGYLAASWVVNKYSIRTQKMIVSPLGSRNTIGVQVAF